jgi:peptidoglycan/LPS O-acetylase OafA/YrhL
MTDIVTRARARLKHADPQAAGIRFEALDSWRGICALLVALMHFPAAGPITESLFVRNAYLFVDYFFVLSGFVIAYGYCHRLGTGLDYTRFAILRTGRIYPLHAAVLLLFVAFETLRWTVPALQGDGAAPFTEATGLRELLNSLQLLNGLGVEDRLTWNGPSWSISAEFWTYLLFGAAVLILGRGIWVALIAAIVAGPAVIYAFSPDYMDATWDLGFVRCLYGFSLGALLCQLAGPGLLRARGPGAVRSEPSTMWTVAEVLAVAAVVGFVSAVGRGPASVAAPFLFAVVLWIFAHERGLVSRVLRTRLFFWLGTLSYGIYLVHIFVQSRMINVASLAQKVTGTELVGTFSLGGSELYGFGVGGAIFGTVMVAVMIVLVVASALAGHFLVERPFQRLSRKLADSLASLRTTRSVAKNVGSRAPA